MKKSATKWIALAVCAVCSVGWIAGTAFALNAGDKQAEPAGDTPVETTAADADLVKDETVYVLAGANGAVEKIIVSDWIQNALGADKISDQTELRDPENVKGDESYTLGGDGSRVWDAQGNDIYYQGDIEKELPVDLSVSYTLDGEPISPDALAGKSGRVRIRFEYKNKQYETVRIDGKDEKIYVPFVMLTGILLDNDRFANVEVSNGKQINDGDRTAVVGLAFPGLQENLALSKDEIALPDFVEITANAKDFQLGMTVTLATNALFRELDTDSFDSISDLEASMDKLDDSMGQLLDGSSALYGGLTTLLDKSGELVSGIDRLASGAKTLKAGTKTLDKGAADLRTGASALQKGLNTLASNNKTLNSGAKQVFDSLLSTANTQLSAAGLKVSKLTIENYAEVLNGVITSLDKNAVYEQALRTLTAAVEAQRATIVEQVTAAVREQVATQVAAAVQEQVTAQVTQTVRGTVEAQVLQSVLKMDKAAYDAAVAAGEIDRETQASVQAAIEQQMQSDAIKQTIAENVEAQMATPAVQETARAKTEEQMQSDTVKQTITENVALQIQKAISENMASDTVQAQLTAAAEGAQSVIGLKASLDSYNAFYLGLQTYTAGVADAAKGAKTLKAGTDDLKAGTKKLYSGASELYDGILTLKRGTPTLTDGVTQLHDGAMQLSDGLKAFNKQGIQKLTELVGDKLSGLVTRLRATKDVAQHYKTFAGASKEMDGQVKFIYRTDSVE